MKQDILWDDDHDILIVDGTIVIGESTEQHQASILLMQKGECRQFPTLGVGIGDYLDDDNLSDLNREIQQNFESDGMTVSKVAIYDNGNLEIDAVYV